MRIIPEVKAARAGDHIEEVAFVIGLADTPMAQICFDPSEIPFRQLDHRFGNIQAVKLEIWIELVKVK